MGIIATRHFCDRLLERYGILCTDKLYERMLEDVFYMRATLIGYTNSVTGVYRVSHKGKDVYVVHKKELGKPGMGVLVTVLEKDALIKNGMLKNSKRL